MKDNSLKRFVIVTQPRSGSYHLVSLLDSAQDVRCFGEVFKKRFVELPKYHLNAMGLREGDMDVRDSDTDQFLNGLFKIGAEPIQGFKAFRKHLKLTGLENPRKRPDWKYIYLKRNGVSSFVSGKRAEKTGIYVMTPGDPVTADDRYKPITIDIENLRKWLVWNDKVTRIWTRRRKKQGDDRIHIIDYKDLNDARCLGDLLSFLGSCGDANDLHSGLAKQFDRPFWDGIENASEMRTFLEASEWANLLPELG